MNIDALNELTEEQKCKLSKLCDVIAGYGSLAVGFSAGVDSAFVLAVAKDVLGDKAIAITAVDASIPERELAEAKAFCEERSIKHIICNVNPLKDERYRVK